MDVGHGGAVAVDPEELRGLAARVTADAARLEGAASEMRAAAYPLADTLIPTSGILAAAGHIAQEASRTADLAAAMRFAADVYELVELQARVLMLGLPHGRPHDDLLRSIEQRARGLEARSPGATEEAERMLVEWRGEHGREFERQLRGGPNALLGMFGISVPRMLAFLSFPMEVLRDRGFGRIPPGQRLRGRAARPRMLPATPGAPAAAPRSIGDMASRVPDGSDATIRVERYTMPDGSREFALYVAGTQSEEGTVLDWASNLKLYVGERSQAYEAVELALRDAGAGPGDPLHAVGFSQGGMIASWLVAEGGYDVRTLVTLGAPVEADAGGGPLVVALRHDDDPVPLLAGGGHPHATGSEGTVLVERTYDPPSTPADLLLPAHRLDSYVETAREFDASADPRLEGVRDRLAHLGEAETIEVFGFRPEQTPERSGREGGGSF
ncbi:hypothetical protein N8K70_16455 [Microbacterium betulae]|uniref:Alpha/beta hydrolase n=1 Tax=Microbacterium betulae TaxID=2981139 RepID=A0AA97I5N5_9MICO|nr:hypothetical protein [Microbacterium sp. AB]WOF22964.1 hypothetical protein N8K70_16455 [Microbacterium sp. AB]